MPTAGVRITGLRETRRAFRKMSGRLDTELRAALREAAWPVARDARGRLAAKYAGASSKTIGPRVTLAGSAVTQRARKVTGKRGDFGALQMTHVMIPALHAHETEIEEAAAGVVDTLAAIGGFL